ncbi:hypothetical protein ACLOJK_007323 [Asimina triloba]
MDTVRGLLSRTDSGCCPRRRLLVAARMEHGGVAGRRLLGVMQIYDGWRDGGRCCRREGGVMGIGSWLIVVEAELVAADGFYLSSPKMLDGIVDPDLEKGAALAVDGDGRRRVDADGNGGRRRWRPYLA